MEVATLTASVQVISEVSKFIIANEENPNLLSLKQKIEDYIQQMRLLDKSCFGQGILLEFKLLDLRRTIAIDSAYVKLETKTLKRACNPNNHPSEEIKDFCILLKDRIDMLFNKPIFTTSAQTKIKNLYSNLTQEIKNESAEE